MKKMVPLLKQSKKERRKYYASKRGSWNEVSPVTRVVQSRKIYDRKRMKSADRKRYAQSESPPQSNSAREILYYFISENTNTTIPSTTRTTPVARLRVLG